MGQKWYQVKMLKVLFWAFSALFEIVDFDNFRFGFLLKLRTVLKCFDDIWRFLGGPLKTTRENRFFVHGGGVHSWVFGCLVRMGKTHICANLL